MPLDAPGWCAGASLAMKCVDQQRDVVLALAQRRHGAAARRAGGRRGPRGSGPPPPRPDVAVGGRETRTSTLMRLLAADALELALLQHAQQLRLQARRHVANLVEEQRALVGQLEAAELALDRAGERALLVPEQLGLEQRLGSAPQLTLTNGPLRALRARVDRARHQLLAGARLAVDGDRRVGRARPSRSSRTPRASAAVSPTISSKRYGAAASARSAAFSASARSRARRSLRSSSARATFSRTTSGANGFCRKSKAPRRIASTAVSTVPNAVTIIDRAVGIALAHRLDHVERRRRPPS